MHRSVSPGSTSPARVVAIGFASIGAAMGIGRFAFTPLLPLMQQHDGLTLANGTWLAVANYLGYLVGAVLGVVRPLPAGRAARWGLVAVAVSTLGMALTHDLVAWLALRFVAGVASAFVLFGVSGWALPRLAAAARADLTGYVFAGVGSGIAVAGAIAFLVGTRSGDPGPAWATLGALAAAVLAFAWTSYRAEADAHATKPVAAAPLDRAAWTLTLCYGIAGFGYIVPATFLPAAARALINDPAIFGWVWPVFGIAAALSAVAMATVFRRVSARAMCTGGIYVMAVGTVAPVLHTNIATLLVAAICVGGTFVVVTAAGIQEARRLASAAPARLIASMTSTFALGQLVGPLLVHAGESALDAMRTPSLVASVLLFASATVLVVSRPARS